MQIKRRGFGNGLPAPTPDRTEALSKNYLIMGVRAESVKEAVNDHTFADRRLRIVVRVRILKVKVGNFL